MLELNLNYLIIPLPSWLVTLYLLWRLRRFRESVLTRASATVMATIVAKD